jgi:hypothetical protein
MSAHHHTSSHCCKLHTPNRTDYNFQAALTTAAGWSLPFGWWSIYAALHTHALLKTTGFHRAIGETTPSHSSDVLRQKFTRLDATGLISKCRRAHASRHQPSVRQQIEAVE